MRCHEVWGGYHEVNNGVVMAGLDAWLYSRPFGGQGGGGDIHYVSSCAAGLLTRVLVADVSGHGQIVSQTADKLRNLMRRYVNYIDQSRLVSELNVEFGNLSETGRFATAVVGTYVAPTSEFTLCNAGHPRPLWYQRKTGRWTLISAPTDAGEHQADMPLGIAEPTCYNQFKVKLATGDILVLYTDSLIESAGPDGQMLGEDGLLNLAQSLDPSDPSELLTQLIGAVSRRAGGEITGDDVTVLVLRPNGLHPRLSMFKVLMGEVRMFFSLVASAMPGGPEFAAPDSGPFARVGAWVERRRSRRA